MDKKGTNWHSSFILCGNPLDSTVYKYTSNRLSSTKGGNREMDKLYKMSQVSNITRKTKFSHIAWHVFQDQIKKWKKKENKEHIKLHLLYCKRSTLF